VDDLNAPGTKDDELDRPRGLGSVAIEALARSWIAFYQSDSKEHVNKLPSMNKDRGLTCKLYLPLRALVGPSSEDPDATAAKFLRAST
jgi:hypothetical protein